MMAHYGKFYGVNNYIALVGKKSADSDEKFYLGIAEYHFETVTDKAVNREQKTEL